MTIKGGAGAICENDGETPPNPPYQGGRKRRSGDRMGNEMDSRLPSRLALLRSGRYAGMTDALARSAGMTNPPNPPYQGGRERMTESP
jgi:hypothetical protein